MKPNPTLVPEKEEWERRFNDDFEYLGEGKWLYWYNSFDEDDQPLDRVKGYAIPDIFKDFISHQKSQSFNEGYLKALEDVEREILKEEDSGSDVIAWSRNTLIELQRSRLEELRKVNEGT